MLQSISWKQFFESVAVLMVLYYIYVAVKYYREELLGFISGKRAEGKTPAGGLAVVPVGGIAGAGGNGGKRTFAGTADAGSDSTLLGQDRNSLAGAAADSGQAVLFKSEALGSGETPELFKVMEKVMTLLKGVVSQGVVAGRNREELTDHLGEVLAGYHQLKGTPYQEAINSFLVRTCTTNFSFAPDEQELQRLWR